MLGSHSLCALQTYLHGYRISLSEVEAALMGCAGVESAVAVITEDLTGNQRLVVRVPLLHDGMLRVPSQHACGAVPCSCSERSSRP